MLARTRITAHLHNITKKPNENMCFRFVSRNLCDDQEMLVFELARISEVQSSKSITQEKH